MANAAHCCMYYSTSITSSLAFLFSFLQKVFLQNSQICKYFSSQFFLVFNKCSEISVSGNKINIKTFWSIGLLISLHNIHIIIRSASCRACTILTLRKCKLERGVYWGILYIIFNLIICYFRIMLWSPVMKLWK